MNSNSLNNLIQEIVTNARALSKKHTDEHSAPVNYACIFSQNETEYRELISLTEQLGTIVEETAMGPVFRITPVSTTAGELHLLKIRRPDSNRSERGDADFTVSDYKKFKQKYLGKPGFNLIERKDTEMIELTDPVFNVLAYYSYPTLAEVLKIPIE